MCVEFKIIKKIPLEGTFHAAKTGQRHLAIPKNQPTTKNRDYPQKVPFLCILGKQALKDE
jgi:hypothetical protein